MKFIRWIAIIVAGLFSIGAFFVVGVNTGEMEASMSAINGGTIYSRGCRYRFWDGEKAKQPIITGSNRTQLLKQTLNCPWFNVD